MNITITLTDEQLKRLDQWIAPQVKQCTMRGTSIAQRFHYDTYIAYLVWKTWKDNNEHLDEPNNPAPTEELGGKSGFGNISTE